MRAGWLMHRLMSSRSLMMGKLRTEESKKEIRNRPGAPREPAKTNIFCFQRLNLDVNASPLRAVTCGQEILAEGRDFPVRCAREFAGAKVSKISQHRVNRSSKR